MVSLFGSEGESCIDAYQILGLSLSNSVKMEHQELETIAMFLGQSLEGLAQVIAAFCLINNAYVELVFKLPYDRVKHTG